MNPLTLLRWADELNASLRKDNITPDIDQATVAAHKALLDLANLLISKLPKPTNE